MITVLEILACIAAANHLRMMRDPDVRAFKNRYRKNIRIK